MFCMYLLNITTILKVEFVDGAYFEEVTSDEYMELHPYLNELNIYVNYVIIRDKSELNKLPKTVKGFKILTYLNNIMKYKLNEFQLDRLCFKCYGKELTHKNKLDELDLKNSKELEFLHINKNTISFK